MNLVGTYHLKYYIHSSHAIRWENGEGDEHAHSWEIAVEFRSTNENMIVFDKIESSLDDLFKAYSGKFLNTVEPFTTIDPTLENITKFFFTLVEKQILPMHAQLNKIELGESPMRFYYVTRDDMSGE
ncbi:6-carboxytetrahydropterin synthase [Leuconostoc mesenteroides]|uniref:6-carboxytetrahydropterin synthase n=1 Tax=Leuconostoc mesenteroides TaxID=1245 RepID=UPI000C9ADDFF|nr:6-carboxytetrahydropterin synthase [Leuconostoc mesenteroides]PND40682.1 6-pyruvoyl tetrahydropterin synthase [Leuconostoc mesenteroides]